MGDSAATWRCRGRSRNGHGALSGTRAQLCLDWPAAPGRCRRPARSGLPRPGREFRPLSPAWCVGVELEHGVRFREGRPPHARGAGDGRAAGGCATARRIAAPQLVAPLPLHAATRAGRRLPPRGSAAPTDARLGEARGGVGEPPDGVAPGRPPGRHRPVRRKRSGRCRNDSDASTSRCTGCIRRRCETG